MFPLTTGHHHSHCQGKMEKLLIDLGMFGKKAHPEQKDKILNGMFNSREQEEAG